MTRARELLTHPWLTERVAIALGVFFIAAALPKIGDPPSFAHMIYNYRIVPAGLVNVSALVLPWLEILVGLALVVGTWTRTSAAIVGALLLTFILAISLNLSWSNAIDCGCFDVSAANRTREERLHDMKMVVVRDLGMLLMVAQILAGRTRRPEPR